MSTETENAGLTEAEVAAMDELNEQIESASDDDPVFNADEAVRSKQTAEDAGTLIDKSEPRTEPEVEAKVETDPKVEEEPAKDEPAKVEAVTHQPLLVAQVPDGATERLTKIVEERNALSALFDDGELTASELNASLDKLNKEERTLERQIDRAEIARDMEYQRIANERTTEISTFLKDVQIPNDPSNLRFKTLNQAVIEVANDPVNAELGATEIMQKAYDLCVKEGVLPAKSGKVEPKPTKAAPKVINAPPTLANVPASDISETDENRFAHLNRMGPDAREKAFAKLSEADQYAYLAAGA